VQNLAIDGSGNVWTLDSDPSFTSRLITKLSPSGTVLSGSTGYPIPSDAGSLAIDQDGNAWLAGNGNVYRVSVSGTVTTFHPDEPASYNNIAMDASGNIWLNTSSGTPALVELSPSGTDLHYTATGPIGNQGLAVSNSGIVWTTSGIQSALYGTSIATGNNLNVTESALNSPNGVALDSAGNIWVSESCCIGTAISEFSYNTSTSTYNRVSSTGFDDRPLGMSVDGANNVWVLRRYPSASIASFSNSGSGIQVNAAYSINGYYVLNGLGLDPSGDMWTTYGPNIFEFVGVSTPVVTPLSVAVKNNTVATRP
jgi:streptogramin lyase